MLIKFNKVVKCEPLYNKSGIALAYACVDDSGKVLFTDIEPFKVMSDLEFAKLVKNELGIKLYFVRGHRSSAKSWMLFTSNKTVMHYKKAYLLYHNLQQRSFGKVYPVIQYNKHFIFYPFSTLSFKYYKDTIRCLHYPIHWNLLIDLIYLHDSDVLDKMGERGFEYSFTKITRSNNYVNNGHRNST